MCVCAFIGDLNVSPSIYCAMPAQSQLATNRVDGMIGKQIVLWPEWIEWCGRHRVREERIGERIGERKGERIGGERKGFPRAHR